MATSSARGRVLYISYDGATDPLGESQVVPYVERLAHRGYQMTLMTFEKPEVDRQSVTAMKRRLESAHVLWIPLPYHKTPSVLATSFDLSHAVLSALRLRTRYQFDLIHTRSYLAGLAGWTIGRLLSVPYLFDIRGLYPEERVEAGLWTESGLTYRTTKRIEHSLFRDAATIVTLTHSSVPLVTAMVERSGGLATTVVIPTCVDLARFKPVDTRRQQFTLSYCGSAGGFYMLAEMLRFGSVILRMVPNSRLLFLVNNGRDEVWRQARELAIDERSIDITSVPYSQVPPLLAGCDASISFIKPGPSKIASAATKFSESMALGIPAIVNEGIGDAANLVLDRRVGLIARPYDFSSFEKKIEELIDLCRDPQVNLRCRTLAETTFNIELAIDQYCDIYDEAIMKNRGH